MSGLETRTSRPVRILHGCCQWETSAAVSVRCGVFNSKRLRLTGPVLKDLTRFSAPTFRFQPLLLVDFFLYNGLTQVSRLSPLYRVTHWLSGRKHLTVRNSGLQNNERKPSTVYPIKKCTAGGRNFKNFSKTARLATAQEKKKHWLNGYP